MVKPIFYFILQILINSILENLINLNFIIVILVYCTYPKLTNNTFLKLKILFNHPVQSHFFLIKNKKKKKKDFHI